jgi:hypothetical protein
VSSSPTSEQKLKKPIADSSKVFLTRQPLRLIRYPKDRSGLLSTESWKGGQQLLLPTTWLQLHMRIVYTSWIKEGSLSTAVMMICLLGGVCIGDFSHFKILKAKNNKGDTPLTMALYGNDDPGSKVIDAILMHGAISKVGITQTIGKY